MDEVPDKFKLDFIYLINMTRCVHQIITNYKVPVTQHYVCHIIFILFYSMFRPIHKAVIR
jgi:uncharacterized membrane protein YcaP (DUF421 family)